MFHALHKVDMRVCYAKQKINLAVLTCIEKTIMRDEYKNVYIDKKYICNEK